MKRGLEQDALEDDILGALDDNEELEECLD
jgi:hypothetical protein